VTRSLRASFVLGLALAPWRASAQDALTVDRAVQAALAHNASLRAARAGADEAAAAIPAARSDRYPRISVTESWQRGDQPVFVFSSLLSARQFAATNFAIDALNHPDPIGFFRTSVGVQQTLFDGGRQRAAALAAARQTDVARLAADETAMAVALATTQTFGRVVIAEAAERAARGGGDAAREDLARAERRRDAGMATDADVLALAVYVANLDERAIQAASDAATARAELNRLMGAPIDAEVRVAEPVRGPLDATATRANLAALFAEADANRPEIKRAADMADAADAARRQARAALVPQIGAQAAFDVSGTRFTDRASSWVVGGELRWTFSTGGAELAGINAAAARIARAHAEADDTRASVHVDVITTLGRVEAARGREAVSRAAVDQARESVRIVRDRFDAGMAPVNDVLRASSALLDAETNRVSALVDVMVASAALGRALGRTP
jgi:outer membrane protein TolC